MTIHRAKGKDLLNHDMRSIFKELYQIEKILNSNKYVGQQNYITIRLVTIIEQFFREIVGFLLKKYPEKRPQTIELDTRLIDSVVKITSEWDKAFITERLISQAFSFQNTNVINETMKKYGNIHIIQDSSKPLNPDNRDGFLKQDYDRFFDARHSIVHSIERRPYLNVKKYYYMTEKLLDYTLEKVGYHGFYEDCDEIALLFQKSKADTYHKMANRLRNEIKNEHESAMNAMKRKQYAEAIHHYDEVLKREPSNSFAYVDKGWAFYQLENYPKAIESLEHGLELIDDPDMYIPLGLALQKLGEHEDAIKYFTEAIQHNTNDGLAYDSLAISTGSTGWPSEALRYAEMALDIDPNDEIALDIKKLTETYLNRLKKIRGNRI